MCPWIQGDRAVFRNILQNINIVFFSLWDSTHWQGRIQGGTRVQCPPPRLELLYLSNLKLKSEELKDQNHDRREVVLIQFMLASTYEQFTCVLRNHGLSKSLQVYQGKLQIRGQVIVYKIAKCITQSPERKYCYREALQNLYFQLFNQPRIKVIKQLQSKFNRLF